MPMKHYHTSAHSKKKQESPDRPSCPDLKALNPYLTVFNAI